MSYESAGHLFAKLEKNHFSRTEATEAAVAEIEKADLLIIDDLGTELAGNFVTAALYSLLNDRILSGKPTIISTNLPVEAIQDIYSERISSRIISYYDIFLIFGEDIRIRIARSRF